MNTRKLILYALSVFYAILWVGGIGSYAWQGGAGSNIAWAAPVFLFVAGLMVVISSSKSDWILLLAAAFFGFSSEIIGVCSGWPFGAYDYTNALSPKLFGIPLAIIFAWVVLAVYIRQLSARLQLTMLPTVVISAAWMTLIDLVIDPLAANDLGYWRWSNKGLYYGVPASNFVGWFIVSFIIFLISSFGSRSIPQINHWAIYTGLSIILFFTLLAILAQFYVATLVGITLILIHVLLFKPSVRFSNAPAN